MSVKENIEFKYSQTAPLNISQEISVIFVGKNWFPFAQGEVTENYKKNFKLFWCFYHWPYFQSKLWIQIANWQQNLFIKLIGTYIIFSHDKVIPKVINANRISPYAKMITGTTEIIATVVVLFVSTLPLTEFAEIYYKNTKYKNWGSQDWKFDMCQW